jgi:hypothetical protein
MFLRQIAILLVSSSAIVPFAAFSAVLEPVPDPAVRRSTFGSDVPDLLSKPFTCPEPPGPVVELAIESAYRPEDPTQSQVEKGREDMRGELKRFERSR